MSNTLNSPEQQMNMAQKSPASSENLCSPKSADSKKSSSDSTSRRKRKPKKVAGVEASFSDVEMTDISPPPNINPAISAIAQREMKTDSDDCETIDKIAQMVSNFTSSTPVSSKPISPVMQNFTNQPPALNINEVENRLEEMFSDSKAATSSEQPPPNIAQEGNAQNDTKMSEQEQQPKPKPKPRGRKKKDPEANGKKLKKNAALNGKVNKNEKLLAGKKSTKETDKQDKQKKKGRKSKENGGKAKVKADVAPYLQIQNDGSFNIINQTVNREDDGEKPITKSKKAGTTEKHKGIRGLHVSTLSNKYDIEKRDTNWMCVFCKLGPHKHKLGDLFGPYIVSKNSKEYSLCLEDPAHDIFRQSNANKFMPIASPPPAKKKRKSSESARKLSSPTTSAAAAVIGPDVSDEVFTGMTQIDEQNYEIWFHEDCIVWSPGTHIIGSKIIGMEQAVWQSTRYRCVYCQKNGAMVSCLARGCKKEAHFVCARKSWKLCDDFKTKCEQHSN